MARIIKKRIFVTTIIAVLLVGCSGLSGSEITHDVIETAHENSSNLFYKTARYRMTHSVTAMKQAGSNDKLIMQLFPRDKYVVFIQILERQRGKGLGDLVGYTQINAIVKSEQCNKTNSEQLGRSEIRKKNNCMNVDKNTK
ncbi:hypothetical protein, partial [Escherichia coli]|uniref:hypothetical protein n=1 Tax=Escherichia coli TaxID=562 RepID=UPI000CDB1401